MITIGLSKVTQVMAFTFSSDFRGLLPPVTPRSARPWCRHRGAKATSVRGATKVPAKRGSWASE